MFRPKRAMVKSTVISLILVIAIAAAIAISSGEIRSNNGLAQTTVTQSYATLETIEIPTTVGYSTTVTVINASTITTISYVFSLVKTQFETINGSVVKVTPPK